MRRLYAERIAFSGVATLFALLLISTIALASDLETVKQAIKEKGAHWIAGETENSKLPSHERQSRLGLFKPSHTGAEKVLTSSAPLTGLLPSFDWSTGGKFADGKNYLTPVRNQKSCGSCWAFATTGALESYTLINSNDSLCNINSCDLSEQVLVSCGGAGSCNGGYLEGASNYIQNYGLPVESCYPYSAINGMCSNACSTWNTQTYKIGSWSYVATTSPTVDAIKNALYSYGPLATSMAVYEDFYLHYVGGVYSYVSGNFVGNHAILIVGYMDDSTYPGGGYFRVKNSWGSSWGEQGYFKIAYTELNSVVQFGDWTIAYLPPAAPPLAPSSLTATPVSCSQINLSWADNASNESGFKIERRLDGELYFSQIATVGSNVRSYSNTGLTALSTYNYRVRAYNTGGNSDYSNIAAGTTLAIPQPPLAPSALTVVSKSNNQIKISWVDNSSNEDGFKIERCTGTGCSNFSQIATVGANTTTSTNTGLRKGTAYTYQVRSYNAGGDSAYSNRVAAVANR